MAYDLVVEFKKVKFAFERVRRDVLALREQNSILKEQVAYLKSLVKQNKEMVKANRDLATKNAVLIDGVEKKEIVGNQDSKKVHYTDCPFAKRMRDEHKIYFKTVSEATRKGYKKCVCTKN